MAKAKAKAKEREPCPCRCRCGCSMTAGAQACWLCSQELHASSRRAELIAKLPIVVR